MARSKGWSIPLLALLAASLALPSTADAQLGGLARRAKKAVTDKADDKVDEALYVAPPPPTFDDRVLEITDARLSGMLEGLKVEAASAKSAGPEAERAKSAYEADMKAYEVAEKAYREKLEVYGACADSFHTREIRAALANDSTLEAAFAGMDDEAFEAYAEDLALRGEAIARDAQAGKNDPETLRVREAYVREVAALQAEQSRRVALAMSGRAAEAHRSATEEARLVAACGEEPVAPEAPASPTGPEGVLASKGAEAAGLRVDQYAVMRERLLYWSESEGRPSGMGFSEDEMALLSAKKDAIESAAKALRKAKVPF